MLLVDQKCLGSSQGNAARLYLRLDIPLKVRGDHSTVSRHISGEQEG